MKKIFMAIMLATFLLFLLTNAILAHGKNVYLQIVNLSNDNNNNKHLNKNYVISAKYADGDAVNGAVVNLWAESTNNSNIKTRIITLKPQDTKGNYTGDYIFPSYGKYKVNVKLSGNGTGESTFTEQIEKPIIMSKKDAPILKPDQTKKLKIKLSFGTVDYINIISRLLHIISAIVFVGGMIIFIFTIMPTILSKKQPIPISDFYSKFGNLMSLSLSILILSGIYNAIFNVPNSTTGFGGIFTPSTLFSLEFGNIYFSLLTVKIVFVVIIIAVEYLLGRTKSKRKLRRYNYLSLTAAILIIAISATLTYLHMFSHASQTTIGIGF